MKRAESILLIIAMVFGLCACSSSSNGIPNTPVAPANTTVPSITETVPDTTATQMECSIIDTEYYTIEVPIHWDTECFFEVSDGEHYNYTLSFYDSASHEEINGGWLFSIDLFTEFEDYTIYPNYEVLGSLDVYRIGTYNIVVTYPTDVQYSEKTAVSYKSKEQAVPDILDSISFKDECTYSNDPFEIQKIPQGGEPDTTEPDIIKTFIGRWEQVSGSSAPDGASKWNAQFRSDGTGTFELIYEANDVVYIDFDYSVFIPYWDSMDGIIIEVDGGSDLKFFVSYAWSNQLQTMLMTMFLFDDMDVNWTFKHIMQ